MSNTNTNTETTTLYLEIHTHIWIFPHMSGFYQTLRQVQVSGKNHTCVDKTTHTKVQVISGNSHICLVFTTHIEVLQIKGIGQYIWLNLNQLLSLYTFFENFCRKYFQDVFSLTRNLPLKWKSERRAWKRKQIWLLETKSQW